MEKYTISINVEYKQVGSIIIGSFYNFCIQFDSKTVQQ